MEAKTTPKSLLEIGDTYVQATWHHPADWDNLGKPAGPIRNSAMVKFVTTKTNLTPMLIAFPGGRGTADIIRKARAAGMEVVTL